MSPEKQRLTFISYSRINNDFALQLAKELKAAGFNIWLDQLDIPTGARWDDALEDALDACEIFMVILTPASISSENVKDEIGYAIDHGKRILPVLLKSAKIPLRLRRFQYVDFTTKGYDEGLEGAKQLLRNFLNEPTVPRSEPKPEIPVKIHSEKLATDTEKAVVAAAKKNERLETERKEATRIAVEKAEEARKETARLATEKVETDKKEAKQIAAEKAEKEHKAKLAASMPATKESAAEKTHLQELLKNPKVMYAGIGIIIILFVIILVSALSGGNNTPVIATPLLTETESPTQVIVPSKTPEPTLAPPTPTPAPTATPTFAPPQEPFVRIVEITIGDSQNYVVEYETYGYTETLSGMHIHFFFDTVSPDQAGSPGSGPWKIYGGPRPFTQYAIANRPASAMQMCALVANSNHSIQLDSGNCVDLP